MSDEFLHSRPIQDKASIGALLEKLKGKIAEVVKPIDD